VMHINMSQGSVDFRERVIDFECFQCGCTSARESFFGQHRCDPDISKLGVAIGQACVCQRIVWVALNRLIKALDGTVQRFFCSLVPVEAALQVEMMSCSVFC